MSTTMASVLCWSYADALDVSYALVDQQEVDTDRGRAALALGAHPADIAHCARLRRGGTLSLFLRTVTRELVGTELGVAVGEVRRRRDPCTNCGGAHGRPRFSGRGADSSLWLSVSHSSGIGAVAVSTRRVGIDVQRRLPASQARALEPRLHENDRHQVHSGDPRDHALRATQSWVRKEAHGKALGSGLCRRLADDDLSCWPRVGQVTGMDVPAPPAFHAALAITDRPPSSDA